MFQNFFALLICLLFVQSVHAQSREPLIYGDTDDFPRVLELNWLNEQFLIKQRKRVEAISREHFGQQLKQGEQNISLLQRIIDQELVPKDETLDLQALGVVLGDVYVDTNKNLEWKVYEDELGKSHAVCVKKTKHCLFPVTMLSRRIEVGANADVNRVFNKGIDAIKVHLPKLPFSD